ncbi:FAD-dependent monooxygenase [Paenibacillus filicis]|uniref:FAD-dependent monooxygenase n=1 Tax=Paenibacillus gyeongsangnamensis TaxID=3388067 RepID=A0ABT4Q8G6_9BACL|nr:FAD-dependent monooxygenase [Paenibacillus filicis]MCZ8513173.1 FAD-dependent monooxygenase [Paenibacillus filicis]
MSTLETDVCVIGAGPAGMLLSLLLLREGFRVVLVERSQNFEREFRGEFLQPGALQLLDKLGLLNAMQERGETIKDFCILEKGKLILKFSFEELPGKFRSGLNVSQAYALPLMLDECMKFEGFVLKKGFAPARILEHSGKVYGVSVESPEGKPLEIKSKLVVGADGRSSHMRKLAGFPTYKHPFQMDVLWTKFQRPKDWEEKIEIRIHEGGYLITMPIYPNQLQLGIDMPKGGLKTLREKGLNTLVQRLKNAIPEAKLELDQALNSWSDFQQLPVTGALATKWYKEGLVLIGDAAHTIGPIAGQGVTQALKDAIILCQMIKGHLHRDVVDSSVLHSFQQNRFQEVKSLYKLQSSQEKFLMATSFSGRLTRRTVYWMMMNTPLKKSLAIRMSMKDIETMMV